MLRSLNACVRSMALASMSALLARDTLAQHPDTLRYHVPNYSTYLELGGSAGHASLNVERKLNDSFTARIGLGWWGNPYLSIQRRYLEQARLVPVTLNFIPRLRQESFHRVELGVGMVVGDRWAKLPGNDPREANRGFRAATATAGYRVMYRPFILRLSTTYHYRLGGDYPDTGVRPGASFGFQLPF